MADAKKQDSAPDVAPDLQKAFDKAEEQGYFGDAVDETPRENYTVAGVTAGKPTPETPAEDSKK